VIPAEMCLAETPPRIWCRLPKGHHGRHACVGHCDITWENEAETDPCISTAAASLGIAGPPTLVRCGLLAGHDGMHRFAMVWGGAS
jgi:hypothetical protein